MKLRSLAVNQFRKFTVTTRLDGIEDGLNIVGGPNEMGKSTLLAALRAALFEKYSSGALPIRSLRNERNQAAPVVELEFELADGMYRVAKRFMKKPYARLDCPDGRSLQGDEAEETLRSLLDFNEPGNSGAKPETLGMWNVLWVQQGDSFGSIKLPDSARSSLHGALETQVGAVLGGKRGRVLPQVIENRLGELITSSTSRPRGDYKAWIGRKDAIGEELRQLQGRRLELTQALDELEVVQAELKRLDSGENERKDKKELEKARQSHTELSKLEGQIQAAEAEFSLRKIRLEGALRAITERKLLSESITKQEAALTKLNSRLASRTEEEKTAQAQLDSARAEVRGAVKQLEAAELAESRHKRILYAAERHDQLRDLKGKHEKALAAEQKQHESQRAAAAILATDKALEAIRLAEKAAESANSRLSVAATRISFDFEPQGMEGVTINSEPLPDGRTSVQAVEETRIVIPGRGLIAVEPAIKDRDTLLAGQRASAAALKQALVKVGAESAADAESQHRQRLQFLRDAQIARQEAELYAPATDEREPGAQALGAYIEGLREILERELKELNIKTPPKLQEAETALREAEKQAAAARSNSRAKREATSGPEQELNRVQQELAKLRGQIEVSEERLETDQSQLDTEQQSRPDTALLADKETVSAAIAEQQSIVETLEAKRGDETLLQLDARIYRLENAIKGRRDKRGKLNEQKAGLQSQIRSADGAGLDERIELQERELELAVEELRRKEREVKVLKLLLATLRKAEDEAKERYLTPVLTRVRPYLETLFPGAKILIDENLGITGLIREGGYEEQFQHLSMGTQEQIAVLVRLAFAEMLAEQGHPATVVLDDALVFSDDQRMNRMFDILSMAGAKVQVLIFTCREQLFESLGGQVLSLTTSNGEELISA